jgi:5-methylcytosine-specific restriction endonuclease McrA
MGCTHDARTCPDHGPKAQQKAYDDRRGTRHERGYGAAWDAYRLDFMNALVTLDIPLWCGARLPGTPPTTDSQCAAEGRMTYGRVVDHIVPVKGATDPRFYDRTNLQLLCDGATGRGCHDRKRQRERGEPTRGGA